MNDTTSAAVTAGPDEESVVTVEHILGSHLLRFATREDLAVDWTRTAAQAPPA